jgi:hypothetical protein
MAAPSAPEDPLGAMAQTQDPRSEVGGTGRRRGACTEGHRHRPWGLVERRGLTYARGRHQSVTGSVGTSEPAGSTSRWAAVHVNRRVRTRTHGGVGGREGRLSLLPNQVA